MDRITNFVTGLSPEAIRWIIVAALFATILPLSRLSPVMAFIIFIVLLSGAMFLGMMFGVTF